MTTLSDKSDSFFRTVSQLAYRTDLPTASQTTHEIKSSTLASDGSVRAMNLQEIRLFLYLGVLNFTLETSSNNPLFRVSKSREGERRQRLKLVPPEPSVFNEKGTTTALHLSPEGDSPRDI